jgi:hypothetical protein
MSRKEMVALKLQMGINPSAQIAPNMLLAIWQQLKLERVHADANHSKTRTNPVQMTSLQ